SPDVVGWPFLLLATSGLAAVVVDRRGRSTAALLAAIGVQAIVLWIMARANGADTPYMALKMFYLAVYPLAAAASLAIARTWQAIDRAFGERSVLRGSAGSWFAWAAVLVLGAAIARPLVAARRARPAISEGAFLAGQWARTHAPAACVDYL